MPRVVLELHADDPPRGPVVLPAVVAMFRTTGEVALVLGEVNDVSKPRLRQWAPWPCAPGGTQLPVPELAANHAETRPRYCLLERA